jgi:four helix bundle protein
MGKFENLKVWQRAKALSVKIYIITRNDQISKDFGLKDQIRRASVSVPSNIAEGDESGSTRLSIKYFYTAKGSIAELFTQLQIAQEVGYIEKGIMIDLIDDCQAISSMLTNLIRTRAQQLTPRLS